MTVQQMDNLIQRIEGINDERDSVPLLMEIRKLWPELRARNAELIAALEKIVDLAHYPDESIARAAIAKANDGGING